MYFHNKLTIDDFHETVKEHALFRFVNFFFLGWRDAFFLFYF